MGYCLLLFWLFIFSLAVKIVNPGINLKSLRNFLNLPCRCRRSSDDIPMYAPFIGRWSYQWRAPKSFFLLSWFWLMLWTSTTDAAPKTVANVNRSFSSISFAEKRLWKFAAFFFFQYSQNEKSVVSYWHFKIKQYAKII